MDFKLSRRSLIGLHCTMLPCQPNLATRTVYNSLVLDDLSSTTPSVRQGKTQKCKVKL